ncbi:hypothetical protein [Streptococcus ferus]|uniref:hypothetical protein n=1 Tax=Streptococcus ferus TaxID=1345 RepID=UPI002355461F|nr:hypothetical protein [Streptococcus ferus]
MKVLFSAFDSLANEDKLSGSAYTNIKSYGSSVVTPLVRAFIHLAEDNCPLLHSFID